MTAQVIELSQLETEHVDVDLIKACWRNDWIFELYGVRVLELLDRERMLAALHLETYNHNYVLKKLYYRTNTRELWIKVWVKKHTAKVLPWFEPDVYDDVWLKSVKGAPLVKMETPRQPQLRSIDVSFLL